MTKKSPLRIKMFKMVIERDFQYVVVRDMFEAVVGVVVRSFHEFLIFKKKKNMFQDNNTAYRPPDH